jgi:hypothetical protein
MTEKTVYIAFDGKEFTNKENCIEYETGNFLEVYDANGEIIDNESDDIAERGTYIVCKTREALAYFNINCKQNYIDIIVYEENTFPASFVWKNDGWYNIKNLIAQYQAEIDTLSEYLED